MGKEIQQAIEALRYGYTIPTGTMKEAAMQRKYPLSQEPAIVHPGNSSTVKIRDNGVIDLFVGTDNGIRVDPNQKSIIALSNVYKEKNSYSWMHSERNRTVTVGHDYVLNSGNDEVHNVKGEWTVHAGDKVNVISDGEIYMEGRKKLHLKSPHIVIDTTLPPDELDPVRPPMGLMFEEDATYVMKAPFGYQPHIGAQSHEKRPMYRREEFDDLHADSYESRPSLRGADKVRLDADGEWKGPLLRERYRNGKIELKGSKEIDIRTTEKDGKIKIYSDDVDITGVDIDVIASSDLNLRPFPEHHHPE